MIPSNTLPRQKSLFEISRYLENHPAEVNPAVSIAASVPSSARGHKISFRAMTHDDCRLWFAQLEDVFAFLGISSQTNKFAALTTLLTEEEAYVVRDLTMMGDERPSNVFNAAMSLFVKRYELTVHQRITRALSMNGLAVAEKPSQWMARFRHAGSEWDREYFERWALLPHLPSSLRTTLELPTQQLSMDELLQKVTLPSATVSAIPEMPIELAAAVTSGDLPAVNALFKRRDGNGGNGDKKKKQQQCWYHVKFGDESRCCSGPPCPRYRADFPKGRTTESGNAKGSR